MTQTWVDFYALLELYDPTIPAGKGPDATPDEIKSACREQRYVWHPDRFKEGSRAWVKANERSKLINEACRVLGDPGAKKAYDEKWLDRNGWFREEKKAKAPVTPEIFVRWEPEDAKSELFYNIPRGETRTARIFVEPRVGSGFTVEILEPDSGWLKVVEPKDRKGVPPFEVVVKVDTTAMRGGGEFVDDLVFVVEES